MLQTPCAVLRVVPNIHEEKLDDHFTIGIAAITVESSSMGLRVSDQVSIRACDRDADSIMK